MTDDPVDVVRRGYDAVSHRYRGDDDAPGEYAPWTAAVVDVSDVQIARARRLVPGATFLRADVSELDVENASFDAVVAFCSLIHVPLDQQPLLLRDVVEQGYVPAGGSGHAFFRARRQAAS